MSIWDQHAETARREDLLQVQLERLQETLHRVYRSVPFYRQAFDASGFNPEEFRSLDDLRRLPFTTKAQLAEHYPYGLFAVPLREVVRLHTTSSTTGRPGIVGYTARDIHTWSELTARVLAAAGVTKDDVVQIAFDYGLSPDGFGFHYGAERLGASVIPTSAVRVARQVDLLRDFRSTVLVSPPSVALAIAGHLAEQGIDPKSLFLRVGVFSAEPWSDSLRRDLEGRLLIRAADSYSLSEVFGPGLAGECGEKAGLHLPEDHVFAEIVDPATGQPLPEGREGELVLTTITREAFPLVRYRTGDITRIDTAPCRCGRTLARMARVVARTDDMVSIRGVHFYPAQIEELLAPLEGARPRFQLVLRREGGQEILEVRIEVSERLFFDEMRRQRLLLDEIQRRIQEELKINVRIRLVEPRSLGGDAERTRVHDERPR
jgi:phenylacetate-CoA ligase